MHDTHNDGATSPVARTKPTRTPFERSANLLKNYTWQQFFGLAPATVGASKHASYVSHSIFNLSFGFNPINLTTFHNLLSLFVYVIQDILYGLASILCSGIIKSLLELYSNPTVCNKLAAAIALVIIILTVAILLAASLAKILISPLLEPILTYDKLKTQTPVLAKICLAYTLLCYATLFIFAAPLIRLMIPKASAAVVLFFSQHCASIPVISKIGLAISKLGVFLASNTITPILSTAHIAVGASIVAPVVGVTTTACLFSAASMIPTTPGKVKELCATPSTTYSRA